MPVLRHWDQPDDLMDTEAVKKSTIKGKGVSLARLVIVAGTKADRHSHPVEQFVQVVSGSGQLETQDGVQPFSAGSVFHFLPNTWHAAIFEEDTVLIETNL